MKNKIIKTIAGLYIVAAPFIGGYVGRGIEKSSHSNDGLVLTVLGDEKFSSLNISARFGSDEISLNDLGGKYSQKLAPHQNQRIWTNRSEEVAGATRYLLLDKDNLSDVYPSRFRVDANETTPQRTSIRLIPGKRDFEYNYSEF